MFRNSVIVKYLFFAACVDLKTYFNSHCSLICTIILSARLFLEFVSVNILWQLYMVVVENQSLQTSGLVCISGRRFPFYIVFFSELSFTTSFLRINMLS